MLNVTTEFKQKVHSALLEVRENFTGADAAFAKQWNLHGSVYSQIKNGNLEGNLIKEAQWIEIGRKLNVTTNDRKWNFARTDVFVKIQSDIQFCKANSKAMIFVDDCEIGKTQAAKYLSKTLQNCFYVDASQVETKTQLIRALATAIGVDSDGRFAEIKGRIKYALQAMPIPIVMIDDPGGWKLDSFLLLKEFWNATENVCGWYLIGDDSLQSLIDRGIRNKKPGIRAFFSRFSSNYARITPTDKEEKKAFYRNLITAVLSVNMADKSNLTALVQRSLTLTHSGQFGGLRRAESILILNSN